MPGIKPPLILAPLRAPPCDLGAQLFGGKNAFFLKLSPRAWTQRQTCTSSTLTPRSASSATSPRMVKSDLARSTSQSTCAPDRIFGLYPPILPAPTPPVSRCRRPHKIPTLTEHQRPQPPAQPHPP